MFYIYIIYSESSDLYYVGYSNDPFRRVEEHNTKPFSTYTSKHRPWRLKAVFLCSQDEKEAMKIERFIKKQKSRKLLEKICDKTFVPTGDLARLPARLKPFGRARPAEAVRTGLESRMCGINQRVVPTKVGTGGTSFKTWQ